jgi:hypothetical protein
MNRNSLKFTAKAVNLSEFPTGHLIRKQFFSKRDFV